MSAPPSTQGRSLTAHLVARPGTQDEFGQTLRGLAQELEAQPGCCACVLAQELTGGPRFLLYLAWASEAAMRACLASEPYRVLLGATSTLSVTDGDLRLPRSPAARPLPPPMPLPQ